MDECVFQTASPRMRAFYQHIHPDYATLRVEVFRALLIICHDGMYADSRVCAYEDLRYDSFYVVSL